MSFDMINKQGLSEIISKPGAKIKIIILKWVRVRVFGELPIESAKLERQRGFGDHSHHAPPPGSAGSASAQAWSSGDGFHGHQSHYEDQSFYESNYNHYHHSGGHFNGGAGFGSGHQGPFSGRKRPWNHQNQDHNSSGHAKLYVAQVPRMASEQDIRLLFEQYGNIVEVVMLKDKRTGLQQGKCFVKYATPLDADKAIAALNNLYTFPGEVVPITVRYADGEKERLGVRDKVFVAMLNKEASVKEVEAMFSPYGIVEDVFIVRDEMNQSRGCGFVKFSHADMANAAIKGLHGNHIMRGCDLPLVVRFADPKKQRSGESRSNNMFSVTKFGPRYQESSSWPTNDPADSMLGFNQPNAPHPMRHFSSSQPQATSLAQNQESLKFSQMPLQHMQNSESSSQSFQGAVPDLQKQFHAIQSKQKLELQQTGRQPPQPSGSSSRGNLTLTAVPENPQTPELSECDWSEHTCPDGYKYYYNSVSCKSLWNKPKEYALFEERVKKPRRQQSPWQQFQSRSPVLSTQKLAQSLEIQNQNDVLDDKRHLKKPSLDVPEYDRVEAQ